PIEPAPGPSPAGTHRRDRSAQPSTRGGGRAMLGLLSTEEPPMSALRPALAAVGLGLMTGCGPRSEGPPPAGKAPPEAPVLVQPDGRYPVVPLEKDVVVVKVIQNGATNLQDAASADAGLEA